MSKRDHSKMNGLEDSAGGSKHKRRREAGGSLSDMDITMADPVEPKKQLSKAELKEMGMKIWIAVKDAVKDGRALAEPFLKKPPKKIYPNYYVLIENPIALEDIKKRLDNGSYASLEAVQADFELMFANAKQFNLPESDIYLDAKDLLKLVHKTYKKLSPSDKNSSEKAKPPSLTKTLKSKLDKLTSKTDSTGRYLSTEFMALPPKKIWAIYYQTIQNPECFDNIYKRLKGKEYMSSAQFAADVELIFSNALSFNQEGTQIYEDTLNMKDYFKQLMSDLPAPHNLPEYSKPTNKIKIRPPQPQALPTSSSNASAKITAAPLTLRVPRAQPVASTSTATPKAAPRSPAPVPRPTPNTSTLPVAPLTANRPSSKIAPKTATPKVAPKASNPQTLVPPAQVAKLKSATPQPAAQPVSYIQAVPPQYSQTQTPYVPPLAAPVPIAIAPMTAPSPAILRTSSVVNTQKTASQSPVPVVYPLNRQLRSAILRIQPRGRLLSLDHRDGVSNWSINLLPGETSVLVNQITYMEEEEDDGSEDEDIDIEKDDGDEDMDLDHEGSSPQNGRKKKRGRGRPPKKLTATAKASKAAIKKPPASKLGEVQVKLNNFVVTPQPENAGEWSVTPLTGANVIEIGEVNGMIWKVYAEKPAEP
ncbi:Bromodomain-containing protein [Crepidotus variabilis]|uniref:Bromodomain-containing protein n=1 Tax=Crepidotus variabilis TaxID=179855 RepID=A0A9P6JSF7_9AGAR|nr:Bromodomain-containing protein [Crepidotus variabilis]